MCDINRCGSDTDLPAVEVDPESRRLFLQRAMTLPLASVLAWPELSRAAAESLETVSIEVGGETVSAALAMPDTGPAPAVILIHEWWGLNDQIKSVAAELANLGYVALAVDLYGGSVATTADSAQNLMGKVSAERATATLNGWNAWLRANKNVTGKIGTVGWCFGGGWSLQASLSAPVEATVVYYGNVAVGAGDLANLEGPLLGHFATKDGWINKPMVSGFESAMAEAGKADGLTVHWYEADHAFANPSSARYDAHDAALAWQRTTAFFDEHLR